MSASDPADHEAEGYFDALAGRPPADEGAASRGVLALRAALQAEARCVAEAEAKAGTALSPSEQAHLDAIKQQLLAQGVLAPAKPPLTVRAPSSGLRKRLAWLLGGGWQAPLAVAASLMLASVLVLQLTLPPDDTAPVERGRPTPALVVDDPQATAQALAQKLEQAGADVLVVQIHAQEWSLQAEVPRKADPAAVRKVLADAGISSPGEPPYRISIRARR